MVEAVDIRRDVDEITDLIRTSSIGVAQAFGLNEQNCPYHVAFMTRERMLGQLDRPDAYCFGIREGGEWIGFVALAPYSGAYEITRLVVLPDYRHRGYGRKLVDAACDQARKIGLQEVGLGMIDENTRLKRWYEAQGFIADEPFRSPGAAFTTCAMSKTLN